MPVDFNVRSVLSRSPRKGSIRVLSVTPRTYQRFLWILAFGLNSGSVLQAQVRERMVIATDVVCRTRPEFSAPRAHMYELGDIAGVTNESKGEGGSWYFDQWRVSGQSPSCWVYGPLTADFAESNPGPALLALMDHLLQRPNAARFEDYVAVENLLMEARFSSLVMSSGLLRFRRLTIIHRAISREDARGHMIDKDPLKKAWVLSHKDVVYYFEIGDEWRMRPETYWSLFEQYKEAPWAEDLAWAAAQLPLSGDECYADCLLERINKTFLQYWTRFPKGYAIDQALTKAAQIAEDAANIACFDKDPNYSVSRPLLTNIRNNLMEVTAPAKSQLLKFIDQIELKCYSDQK